MVSPSGALYLFLTVNIYLLLAYSLIGRSDDTLISVEA